MIDKTILDIPVFGSLIPLRRLLCYLLETLLFGEIVSFVFVQIFINRGQSKSMFAQDFQFLTPSPFFIPVHFTCVILHQRMFASVSYPHSKKVPRT